MAQLINMQLDRSFTRPFCSVMECCSIVLAMLLTFSSCTATCTIVFCKPACLQWVMKADLRISIKDYQKNLESGWSVVEWCRKFRPRLPSGGFVVRMNPNTGRDGRLASVADTLAERFAHVVGRGRTGPDGVGGIGELACSHKVIEAGLRFLASVNCAGAMPQLSTAGVRPSSGAAVCEGLRAPVNTGCATHANLSAPGDGRTPPPIPEGLRGGRRGDHGPQMTGPRDKSWRRILDKRERR